MRLLAVCSAGLSIVSTFICGCGAIRYPNYYELGTPAPIARGKTAPPLIRSVAVRQFDAPPFLRTGPIAYRESPERLGFYPYDRWAVEVDRGKSVSIDVRVSAGLIDFQTGKILWHGSASSDAVVEQRSIS